ncbi:transcriptional regulator [candidate division WOR-3 bacterium]|nr:transcriptional regulator [candidate division WOR-3 bacterium]
MNIKNIQGKTLGKKSAYLISTLYEQNQTIFRLKDIRDILNTDAASAINFARKLVNRHIVTRLKPGLFIIINYDLGMTNEFIGNEYIIAKELINNNNYYISHFSAMEIHGMITQPQFTVYAVCIKKIRPVKIHGIEFKFISINENEYFGYEPYWVTKQDKILISNLEKTIVDGFKNPQYCGGITEISKGIWINQKKINVDKLINYCLKIKRGSVIRRLGYIMDIYNIVNIDKLIVLQKQLTNTYSKLDPSLPANGKYLKKWRIQINVSKDELLKAIKT